MYYICKWKVTRKVRNLTETEGVKTMKLYRANFSTNNTDHGVTTWHHFKKDATDEAKEFGGKPKSWTVVTLYQYNHAENIRLLFNGETSLIGKEETIENLKG